MVQNRQNDIDQDTEQKTRPKNYKLQFKVNYGFSLGFLHASILWHSCNHLRILFSYFFWKNDELFFTNELKRIYFKFSWIYLDLNRPRSECIQRTSWHLKCVFGRGVAFESWETKVNDDFPTCRLISIWMVCWLKLCAICIADIKYVNYEKRTIQRHTPQMVNITYIKNTENIHANICILCTIGERLNYIR